MNRHHDLAKEKGWWKDLEGVLEQEGNEVKVPKHLFIILFLAVKSALVATEIAEAIEELRKGNINSYTGERGKPEGFLVELIDARIRIDDLFGFLESNGYMSLERVEEIKLEYNKTRSTKHGGKVF